MKAIAALAAMLAPLPALAQLPAPAPASRCIAGAKLGICMGLFSVFVA